MARAGATPVRLTVGAQAPARALAGSNEIIRRCREIRFIVVPGGKNGGRNTIKIYTMPLRMSLACSALSLALFAADASLAAQVAPPDSTARNPHSVQPERPTVATHAGTVARGWIELEEGAEWDKGPDGARTFLALTNLKIGLASRAQLNLLFNLIRNPLVGGSSLDMGDLTVGVKYRIVDA